LALKVSVRSWCGSARTKTPERLQDVRLMVIDVMKLRAEDGKAKGQVMNLAPMNFFSAFSRCSHSVRIAVA
jgi:hypothetical protein